MLFAVLQGTTVEQSVLNIGGGCVEQMCCSGTSVCPTLRL